MFNKEHFKKLLIKAMGDLNTTDYSKQSGVNRTYISKLLNEKMDNPPSPEILKGLASIAKNNITYEDFMYAAGYLDPGAEVDKFNDKKYSDEIKEQMKEFIDKYKNTNEITEALKIKIEEYKANNHNLEGVALIEKFVEDLFSELDLRESLNLLGELGYNNRIIAINGRKMFMYTDEDIKSRNKHPNRSKNSQVTEVEEAMKIILEQPGLMLKGELLSDESKIILANAIQMGLRTAEEIEKKKNKGDKHE